MSWSNRICLVLMALVYVGAGINHFINVQVYRPFMPPYIPAHDFMIALSGVIEIVLGAALIPQRTRKLASYGIMALLVVFFTVHIYMWSARDTVFADVAPWILLGRIPLQFVLIYWAYVCSQIKGPLTQK